MTDASAASRTAALLFAVDPVGLGGVVLRAGAGPVREHWLGWLTDLLPADTRCRRVPLHVNDDRLLGGLDLSATLQAGKPVAQRGLLAEADGGVLLLAMAERLAFSTAAAIAAAMDTHALRVERHGVGASSPCRIGVVALDEGLSDDEQVPARLRDRLAFHLNLAPMASGEEPSDADTALQGTRAEVASARERLARVLVPADVIEGLCAASLALGVDSSRAVLLACAAARAHAALAGRSMATAADASVAAGLVLASRATRMPASPPPEAQAPESEASDPSSAPDVPPEAEADAPPDDDAPTSPAGAVDDRVLQAALASIPPGLLALLVLGPAANTRGAAAGRAGAAQAGRLRGRPLGARRNTRQAGARLNLIETLRAAAPWQALRRRESPSQSTPAKAPIQVRREDFRVWRFKQRSETTTIFVVDASGSAALHRLAETKGAVELLLADCYVRRDSVAVVAFRGAGAEVLLPPTRSLVRAKRSLAGLPGGGGTPLAAGIAAACTLVDTVRRRGATPVVVLLTDGRANIARDGAPGRARASADALAAAQQMRLRGVAALLLDTSPQPQASARSLAEAMHARYLPLPYAGAALMSQAVRAAGAQGAAATAAAQR